MFWSEEFSFQTCQSILETPFVYNVCVCVFVCVLWSILHRIPLAYLQQYINCFY
jgi:hypothetical protein